MTNLQSPRNNESTMTSMFARGIVAQASLGLWTTLRIAIQENWGGNYGPAKRTWLTSAIVDVLKTKKP